MAPYRSFVVNRAPQYLAEPSKRMNGDARQHNRFQVEAGVLED